MRASESERRAAVKVERDSGQKNVVVNKKQNYKKEETDKQHLLQLWW